MRDSAFDEFSAREPYFAVLTHPKFLRANLTPAREREFFGTGEALVDWMFAIIEAGLVPEFAPVSMLEYGCGLGRLAIPLARRAGSVTAIDRSPVMLDIARREAERRGARPHRVRRSRRVRLRSPGSSTWSSAITCCSGSARRQGLALVRELVDRISPGGVGMFQWP